MASINGFRYEPWESSAAVARRDFRHSYDEMEVKHWKGSKRTKTSPNKKQGCPENDGNHHVFVVLKYIYQTRNSNGEKIHYTTYRKECVGCRKIKKRFFEYNGEPFQVIDATFDLGF